ELGVDLLVGGAGLAEGVDDQIVAFLGGLVLLEAVEGAVLVVLEGALEDLAAAGGAGLVVGELGVGLADIPRLLSTADPAPPGHSLEVPAFGHGARVVLDLVDQLGFGLAVEGPLPRVALGGLGLGPAEGGGGLGVERLGLGGAAALAPGDVAGLAGAVVGPG